MTDWNLTVEQLKKEKRKEQENKRLELLSSEIKELDALETQFQNAGAELAQCKQTLAEVSDRNSPEIAELTLKLDELKAAINELDIELTMQNLIRKNARSEFIKQEILVNELEARKDVGELEFAEYMAATSKLTDLEQIRDGEAEQLKEASAKFNALRVIPDYSILDRRIRELKTEILDAQQRVANVELDRRQMNARMNYIRSFLSNH
jgi:chromosome segregation ATPase